MNLTVGAKCTGSYMGSTFHGTIRSYRQHTINPKVTLVSVDLSEPCHIAVIDRTEDTGLMLATSYDGSPCDPSAGSWGDLGDYVEVIPS